MYVGIYPKTCSEHFSLSLILYLLINKYINALKKFMTLNFDIYMN